MRQGHEHASCSTSGSPSRYAEARRGRGGGVLRARALRSPRPRRSAPAPVRVAPITRVHRAPCTEPRRWPPQFPLNFHPPRRPGQLEAWRLARRGAGAPANRLDRAPSPPVRQRARRVPRSARRPSSPSATQPLASRRAAESRPCQQREARARLRVAAVDEARAKSSVAGGRQRMGARLVVVLEV